MHTIVGLGMLCLVLAGLRMLFVRWNAEVPQPATAGGALIQTPYVAEEGSGVFHKRICTQIMEWRLPGVPVPKAGLGKLMTFQTRQDAINAGYRPCTKCYP